ncbi:hypothetical protein A2V55_01645 [Candidatus Woesebacteria bacterium RBG_19FT_COMBO_37_29]|uniref:Adenylate kinase n=2 Tax=Candidatus Woeseibacteriota TaxID=1752722 RepID=A0A1F7XQA1_9BACT|nr:MAG: hypothetical protein A2Z67_04290 [Candidatus Woesebacteria bacterium RBG_13_36_22]OGM17227.1 MAG: hypothetical protein A2V55_01645 [Candidatus Woesebacteria bacterium RBG_19FT_COMBO_37_29]
MNLILLGPPGSGKGTQGKILAKKYNLFYFEAGDFARELAQKDPRIKNIIEKGNLIPEKEMTQYVDKLLEEKKPAGKNILFDGYPRFVSQYKDLANWLSKRQAKIDKAIFLDISDDIVVNRLSSRRICAECGASYNLITNPPLQENKCDKCQGNLIQRSDDTPLSIKERLAEYRINVEPLIEYLKSQGTLLRVSGESSIADITEDIIKEFDKEGLNA